MVNRRELNLFSLELTGIVSLVEWDVWVEVPVALWGVCKMFCNEWGFCSQEPSTHGQPFNGFSPWQLIARNSGGFALPSSGSCPRGAQTSVSERFLGRNHFYYTLTVCGT